MDHSLYDKRHYPVVDVPQGYGEWVHTYEQVVQDEMDIRLLDRITTVNWSACQTVLDLACGTGRIGVWLRAKSPAAIDGVDITPQMLDVARSKRIYRSLYLADVVATGLPDEQYDLCTQSLADEHLPSLAPLYQEVSRVIRQGGYFVLVGFHPYFLMMGIPTHFNRASGESITIRSYVHLLSDHVKAAYEAGWSLVAMDEGVVDAEWIQKKPKWQTHVGLPVSFSMVWQRK